jgi:hypothetical protein
VVVAFHLEGNRRAVAEVDYARVLTGALENSVALRREAAKEERRVLVAAVLGPEE